MPESHPNPSGVEDQANAYTREARHRWNLVKEIVTTVLVDKSALRLRQNQDLPEAMAIGSASDSPDRTTEALLTWLGGLYVVAFQTPDQPGRVGQVHWQDGYIQKAYIRGVLRMETTLARFGSRVMPRSPGDVVKDPFHADAIRVLKEQQYDLFATVKQDFTDDLAPRLRETLVKGYQEQRTVQQISRDLRDQIHLRSEKLGKTRAEMIARTEINRANGEARKRILEGQNIREVNWILNPEACEICAGYADVNPWLLSEIMDYYPGHPNCRCGFAPSGEHIQNPNRGIPV